MRMPGIASATGLISARVRPVCRPKPKQVELSGSARTAPFALRPFASLFNPYPYGCSVLCNHPADCEAKEVVRRAKDSWATEGKALLLPTEMEMIRAGLLAAGGTVSGKVDGNNVTGDGPAGDATSVPEELFRKYTETDSRPLTPAPTLASGPALTNRPAQDASPVPCNPRERTTLILDLRTKQPQQENETFTWHAMTLEPPPTPRRGEVSVCKPVPIKHSSGPVAQHALPLGPPSPIAETCETGSSKNADGDESASEEPVMIRRRGKRLRKRKCRRGSTYGQQTEVRDPLDPPETQVSQITDGSRRPSIAPFDGTAADNEKLPEKSSAPAIEPATLNSFIAPDILKHLCRELDREKVEAEFSLKRRLAFEEALRVKEDGHLCLRGSRQVSTPTSENVPRVFSRQAARFELLNSETLRDLTPLGYLSKHVSVTSGRKLIFGRAFNRFSEETVLGTRHMSPNDVQEALQEVTGKALTEEQQQRLKRLIGEIKEALNFRTWCGVCAAVERLLCPLSNKEVDPPTWLERADFEALERRLKSVEADPKLALFLREIRDV